MENVYKIDECLDCQHGYYKVASVRSCAVAKTGQLTYFITSNPRAGKSFADEMIEKLLNK